jgi:O-antigen/teichoic acid export membrane protein
MGPDGTTEAGAPPTRSQRIAVNSLWAALDFFFGLAGGILSSILIARRFGPEILGYYAYIVTLAGMAGSIARFGLPVATRKYVAEFSARGEYGFVRALLQRMFRWQALFAVAAIAIAGWIALGFLKADFHLVAVVALSSMLPAMMLGIVSAANMAVEDYAGNVLSSLAATIVYLCGVTVTLVMNLSILWLAISLAASRFADFLLRHWMYRRTFQPRFRAAQAKPLPRDVVERIRRFCLQTTALQALNLIVWDRSQMFFLERFSPMSEAGFYSVTFTMVLQSYMLSQTFMSAAGSNLMRRQALDQDGARRMTQTMLIYAGLIALPMNLGLAAVCGPLIAALYGEKYLPAIPVLFIAGLLGSARALMAPAEQLLIAFERQDRLLRTLGVSSLLNIALAFLLIPRWGARGAALSNGLAQCAALGLCWWWARDVFKLPLPWARLSRLAGAALLMAATGWIVSAPLRPVPGLAAGIAAGAASYPLYLRLLGCLDIEDRARLGQITLRLPGPLRRPSQRLLAWLAPAV